MYTFHLLSAGDPVVFPLLALQVANLSEADAQHSFLFALAVVGRVLQDEISLVYCASQDGCCDRTPA